MTYSAARGSSIPYNQRDKWIRLDFNEAPYPPAPAVQYAIKGMLPRVNEYPDTNNVGLRELLSSFLAVPNDSHVLATAGADRAIDLALAVDGQYPDAWKGPNTYRYVGDLFRRHEIEGKGGDAGMEYIASPENPTGQTYLWNERVLIWDRSYEPFCDVDHGGPAKWEVYSFSKGFALAGLRVGALVGPVEQIPKYMYSGKEVSSLAQVALAAALEGESQNYYRMQIATVRALRTYFYEQVKDLGLNPLPSQGNFISMNVGDGEKCAEFLREKMILVRWFPDWKDHIRVTIGRPEEMETVLTNLGRWCRIGT